MANCAETADSSDMDFCVDSVNAFQAFQPRAAGEEIEKCANAFDLPTFSATPDMPSLFTPGHSSGCQACKFSSHRFKGMWLDEQRRRTKTV